MNKLTFHHIFRNGVIISETPDYQHYHFETFLEMYDANLLLLKHMPAVSAFKVLEGYLAEFHHTKGQTHLKFIFPENQQLPAALVDYLKAENYILNGLELYAIEPQQFKAKTTSRDIVIQEVNEGNLADFSNLIYSAAVQFGKNYAQKKQAYLEKEILKNKAHFLIAYLAGKPAGSLEIIETDATIEINDLDVIEIARHQGVATALQKRLMEMAKEKLVILVADKNDTPKIMYQNQGYQLLGFQLDALKTND